MSTKHGDFVWYELMTNDADAAQKFYAGLLGWTFDEASFGNADYRAFSAENGHIGGFLQLSEEMKSGGARPDWVGYIHVDNLDAAIEKLKGAGATLIMGPAEVPDVGPFAMIADRQGAPFYVIEDRSGEESVAFSKHDPQVGHCAWNELTTADPADAKAFYGEQFGWVVSDSMEMGEAGLYEMLKNGADREFTFGAVMLKPDGMPVSKWFFIFRVPDIDKAVAYIENNDAKIINGPMEIPGGDFALYGTDPQGAIFALVGPREG